MPPTELRDGAGFFVLEQAAAHAARRGPVRGRLLELTTSYSPHDPFDRELTPAETFTGCAAPDGCFGAASLPVALAAAAAGTIGHSLRARDGIAAHSRWALV